MPAYDFRCNACGRSSNIFYKSYSAYDAAQVEGHICPHCGSRDMTRLISRVTLAKPTVNYANMSSGEMLNVLEGGNTGEVNELMRQTGADKGLEGMGDE
jgi:putative FmdB family regulatory protein